MTSIELLDAFARLTVLLHRIPEGQTVRQCADRIGIAEETAINLWRVVDHLTYNRRVRVGERNGQPVYTLHRACAKRRLLRPLRTAELLALRSALALAGPTPEVRYLLQLLDGGGTAPQDMPVGRPYMVIKGPPPLYRDQALLGLVVTWEKAAAAGRRCEIRYRSSRGKERTERVCPLGTLFVSAHGAWHLAWEGRKGVVRTCPVEGVRVVAQLPETFTPRPPGYLDEPFRDSWGIDGGPIHQVSIRFSPYPPNVIDKVKRETAGRRRTTRQLPDGPYLYQDRVKGLDEVRQWLRGYGQAAEVLEPAALRRMVREGLERYLRRVAEVEAETWEKADQAAHSGAELDPV